MSDESVKAASDHVGEPEPFISTSIAPSLSKQRPEEQVDQTQVAINKTDRAAKIEQSKLCRRPLRSKSDSKYSHMRCARQLNSANALKQGIFPNLPREPSRRRSLNDQTMSEEKKELHHRSFPCVTAPIQPPDDQTFFPLHDSLRSTMGRSRLGSRDAPQWARSFIDQQSIPSVPNPPQPHKAHETNLPAAQTGSHIDVAMGSINSRLFASLHLTDEKKPQKTPDSSDMASSPPRLIKTPTPPKETCASSKASNSPNSVARRTAAFFSS